jgi:hypothetical protein
MSVVGRWRIVEMELWDQYAVDLVAPGLIEFQPDATGSFGFIALQAGLDWREAPREGHPEAEFSWDGFDEGSLATVAAGRRWNPTADACRAAPDLRRQPP